MDDFQKLQYIPRFSNMYLKQCFIFLEIPEKDLYPSGVLTKYLSVFFIIFYNYHLKAISFKVFPRIYLKNCYIIKNAIY